MPLKKHWSTWRQRCADLEKELAAIKQIIPEDKSAATIEYLLDSAEAFMFAARVLTEARDEVHMTAKDIDDEQ